ncbi:hypothetical protein MMC07_005452 [Pseudocyphellaria aurata]|nr:hypothetical protein [Pseudocyphellaria aurata]
MNTIREIQSLNKRELENGVSTEASWHADYRDTAYIYIGGLPFDLTEGDIVAIFSQFGEPVYVNLIRDKESGKSKGFAFLKYEDQRSTDLAVDNLGGATVLGRVLKVDHTRYKRKDDDEELEREQALRGQKDMKDSDLPARQDNDEESDGQERPLLKEEKELAALIRDHDEDDPMKGYLVQEKKEDVAKALAALSKKSHKSVDKKKHHRHHHHRRDRHRSPNRRDTADSDEGRRRKHRA